MAVLRSLLFTIIFIGGTVPLCLFIALLAPFSRAAVQAGSHAWGRWFVLCARVLAGVRLVVRGVVPNRPALVAWKHQSAFETYLTLALFEHPAVVMKQELRSIPLWGFIAARHGSIFLDRGRGTAAMKTLIRESRDRVATGRPILIFPEGTRVAPGAQPPLKAGLAGLYALLDLPVVPVAINSGPHWPKGLVKHPGTITVAFGPDIPPGLSKEAMEARVHAAINADPTLAPVNDGAG
jgi:1-acyl-sn-glycerol-3-phosphate acyltransferase